MHGDEVTTADREPVKDHITTLKEQGCDPAALKRLIDYSMDPVAWLEECVWTKDPASASIRRFPKMDGDQAYLRNIIRPFFEERIFLVEKSRRMICSWMFTALITFEDIFFSNCDSYIISKKEEDSDELVKRSQFILEHLPNDIPWPEWEGKYAKLNYIHTGSSLTGVAQGADQLRQRGARRVFIDEWDFQDRQEESWAAIRPTLEGGGKLCAVTTPGKHRVNGFCYRLINDEDGHAR